MGLFNNQQLQLAFDFVQYTGKRNILQEKMYLESTTFLHNLKKKSPKWMIVVAPTECCSHQCRRCYDPFIFSYAFSLIYLLILQKILLRRMKTVYQTANLQKFSREKINIIKSLDLLVIDEHKQLR